MQAVILAGGKGTRLGAVTASRPKPLVDVGGKPFIVYLIEALKRFGFTDILILTGPFTDIYREMLGSVSGVSLRYVAENPPADTAGALVYAADFLAPEFLMLNGDSFLDFNLLDLVSRDTGAPWMARLALREVDDVGRYGKVVIDNGRVTTMSEKTEGGPGVINAGIYWLKREILAEIAATPCSMERTLLPQLIARDLVQGVVYRGRFIDIGIPSDLERARDLLPQWERRPAAFLDRDGILNRDDGWVHTTEAFVWQPGAMDAVKQLNDAGYFVFVITNQAGIARGFYGPADVRKLHEWVNSELRRQGAHIDEFYFCPHHPEGVVPDYRQACDCRKPAPGLLKQALREWPVDSARSFMIGDKDTDMQAAAAAGVAGYLAADGNALKIVQRLLGAAAPT